MAGDAEPAGKATIGVARNADLALFGIALRNRGLDPRADIGLFTPAPAVVLDRLAVRKAKAG